MAACALAVGTREDEYFEAIRTYDKGELAELSKALALLVTEMESKPFTDILGTYYTEVASHSSKLARGEFYTPPEISKMMAKMTINTEAIKERGLPITVNEPACGAGGMMLAVAEEFAPDSVDLLRVTCQDINPIAVDMCYINTTLWGIPATIIQGNALSSDPGTARTKVWKNVHWARVGEDLRQSHLQIMRLIAEENHDLADSPPETFKPVDYKGQAEFDFDLGDTPILSR